MKKTRMYRRIQARMYARNWFSIPAHIAAEWFQDYFLHYYEGTHIIQAIKEGMINDYVIYYHNVTRGSILANPDKQYACSFRIPKAEFNLPSYVIIGEAN